MPGSRGRARPGRRDPTRRSSGSAVSSAITRDLGRAGEDVDADLAEEHPLRLGDELVARADDDVGGLAGEQAEGHRGDRLHAAERHDHVGAGDVHGVEHVADGCPRPRKGVEQAMTVRTPAAFAVATRHVGRRDVRVASGRHVAAGDVDRDEALARRRRPGCELEREVADAVALREREAAHLRRSRSRCRA